MSLSRRFATAGLIATTLLAAVLAPTPASAWLGWRGWFGEGGWDTPAIVVLGGLVLGEVDTRGYLPARVYPYPVRYRVAQSPVYDGWGAFIGHRRKRVAC
jgi:hypothetical protein